MSTVDILSPLVGRKISSTARLVAVLMAEGVTKTSDIAVLVGVSERMVRHAKAEISGRHAATHCRKQIAERQPIAGNRLPNGNPLPETDCRQQKEIPPTPPKEKYIPRTTVENPSSVAAASARERCTTAALSDDELEAKLLAACNGALDNPANCQGLLNLMIPRMWLRSGADLEAVVLPTLRAMGKRHHGKRIRSWDYFTAAVNDAATAVAARPTPQPQKSVAQSKAEREAFYARYAAMTDVPSGYPEGWVNADG